MFGPEFRAISPTEAEGHVIQHHYSATMPKGRNICFAIGDPMFAVAVYGNGVNPYQADYLARVTGLPVTHENYVELKRLARTEADGPPMSSFLAQCHKRLRPMGYLVVISFSDPEQGHSGGLYRACNFIAAGTTQAELHCIDAEGQPVHRRRAYRYARRHGIEIGEAREALGLTVQRTTPKARWILPLIRRRSVERMLA